MYEVYYFVQVFKKMHNHKMTQWYETQLIYALRLENLPSFKVDNVTHKIQQLEKMLRDIPTRTEVQSIVVLNSRPTGSRPNHASILGDKEISTPIPSDTTITAPMLSHAGDNQSDLNTLIDPCAEPEVGPSEASTSSVLDKSWSNKMDSPLHTPCLIDLDCDITIKTMVIPETQLDTSTSDFLASVPTGIMPSTPVERCVSRGSRSCSRSPPGIGGVCEICVCVSLGAAWVERGWVDESIGFGLYQSCVNRGSIGRVSVFWLRWCGWWRWGVGRVLGPWSGRVGGVMSVWVMSLDYMCRWQVQVSVYCSWRIHAHLRCTQCWILLHLMDICFLTCICLWQISQIQTFLFKVVGPGLVSTSPAFVSNSASHPAGPHGRHAQK